MTKHVKDLLSGYLQPNQHDWQLYLLQNWDAIIGDLQTHVCLEKILNNGTIILGVANSSWMQELHLLSPMLIANINAALDKPYIKQIRFNYSPLKKPAEKKELQKVPKPKAIPLNFKEKKALERIEDTTLQEALKLFLYRIHTIKKMK